jgi:Tfp pilus assembly protein PilX
MRRVAMQRGATLIVVLIMLVLLTLVGTWAIRGSLTSLNIAMNTQAQALLQQASDAVFFNLENQTSDELTLAKMQIGDGMLAYVCVQRIRVKSLFSVSEVAMRIVCLVAGMLVWFIGKDHKLKILNLEQLDFVI